jgi:hypothetical protein
MAVNNANASAVEKEAGFMAGMMPSFGGWQNPDQGFPVKHEHFQVA